MRAFLFIVAVTIAVVACSSTYATSPSEDIETTVNVAPATFRAGDQVTVAVTFINSGSRPRPITDLLCPAPFVVTNQARAVVGPESQACTAPSSIRMLAAGEHFTLTAQWNGSALEQTLDERSMLPPGTYQVHAALGFGEERTPRSQYATVVIEP